jgi:hypothetical protein
LAAVGNQSNGSFNSDLQVFLSISQHKVFFRKEAPGKLGESLRLCLLGEEMGEEACERSPHIGNIGACQIPV